MAESPYLNPSILPFIRGQFPPQYAEKYPLFVAFLAAYYEYLEQRDREASTTYYARGFLDLRDVDRTVDEFFVHLKTKYLDGIQLSTESDSRLLLKHAKDLYRAKGTPRGLELFFRLLYNESISVYYPKEDILRMSSGKWTRPFYLELSIDSDDWMLESKSIQGLTSGATGFVDSVARRTVAGRVSSVAYLSAVSGTFQTGEIITPVDGSLPVSESPSVVGSMNSLLFSTSGSGSGYSVGDVVPVNSPNGLLGEARVTQTVDQTGLIDLELNLGGYGYTNTSQILVSDTVLVLSNIVVTNAYARKYVGIGGQLTQPQATYSFVSATGTINQGDTVQAWTANAVSGNAVVLQSIYTNSTAGILTLAPMSGNLNANTLYTPGNAVTINIGTGGYQDKTAYGYSVGTANLVLSLSSQVGTFSVGETVYQTNPNFPTDGSTQAYGTVSVSSNGFINITGKHGVFVPGQIFGQSSGATANVQSMDMTIGVVTTNGAWTSYTGTGVAGGWTQVNGNWIYGSSMTANVSFVSAAITTKFGIVGLTDTETAYLNTDTLASIANAPLAGPYGLAANSSANSSTNFNQMLSFANVTVGQVQNVYTITPGQQVDSQPLITIIDPRTSTLNSFDLTIFYANSTSSFVIGEDVIQTATGARGQVIAVDSSSISITNMRLSSANQFLTTTNSTTTIIGTLSGSVANAVSVWANRDENPTGKNANASANTVTAHGAVSAVSIVDSGLGYVDGEQVWLGFGNTPGQNAAYGIVKLQTAGTGRGFYSQDGGFMSSGKKFFDGDFYQEFSYQISSSHQLDNYVDTLKRVMHVAGMKVFGRYVHSRNLGSGIKTASALVTQFSSNGTIMGGDQTQYIPILAL